jgi:O-glycosyl hydrolase
MYRNYDGAGSAFGETSVQAVSADQSQLAIYAAQRTADSALTIMVINKTSGDLTSSIALSNFQSSGKAQVWRYSSANLSAILRQTDAAVTANSISATFPANSITLLVVPAGTVSPPRLRMCRLPVAHGRSSSACTRQALRVYMAFVRSR